MSHCYSQLTLPDRRHLQQLIDRKVPVAEIARRLGRHRSTIYRELNRNTFHDAEFSEYSGYYSGIANDLSRERRRCLRKLERHPQLRELIIDRLKALWSPEQIAGRLLADDLSAVRVSTETIYRFIYCKEDYALELYRHLPEGRRKRRPRHTRKPRDGLIPFDCRISQRPDFIADRSQFGHWEGDLLIFRRDLGEANITSLVERKSRYTVMIKTSLCPAELHLRPWYRVSRFQGFGRWDRCQELVLRSEFTVAERRCRERQQAHPPLHAWRYRPVCRQSAATRRPRSPSQFTAKEVPRLSDPGRGVHGAFARLCVNVYFRTSMLHLD